MRILSTLLLALLLFSCYSPERNCKDFKTGTFEYEALVGTEVLTTTFFRNDTIEIDYFKGKSDTSSIRWINDCEYIVRKINPKNMAEEKAIHMKILTTNGDEYLFEYNIVGNTKKQKGTAKKIN
ncbi:MAG: DNA topoisomerase IV [Flavobacteriaceae bacterium]|nr:DNA topoisomerase IV [Flavobacteriaceae bacterium]